MNYMDGHLRDLLNAAAGEPPRQVTVEAVRHRARRRWTVQYLAAAATVAVIAVITPTGIGALGHGAGPSAAGQALPAVPPPSIYLGVFESGPGYGPIGEFAAAVGKQPNLAGYDSGWLLPFPVSFANNMHRHGLTPLVQIDPTLASVSRIASGAYDGYLSAYAQAVRVYGHAVVINFGHEMNTTSVKWGYTHTPPAAFVAAWRHVVTLFRALGADNVTWLWTIEADSPGTGPIRPWWPGANYVTWVGIDGFYTKPSDSFTRIFARTIGQVRALTVKPILLSQTGVARDANQFANILNLFNGLAQYRILGLVWLDSGQWRIENSPLAERAFQAGASGLRLVQP